MAEQSSSALTILTDFLSAARHDALVSCAGGSCTRHAVARLAAAHADVGGRLTQQPPIWEALAERRATLPCAPCRPTGTSPRVPHPIGIGAKAQGASRLMASPVPEAVVKARRSSARHTAQTTGPPLPTPTGPSGPGRS